MLHVRGGIYVSGILLVITELHTERRELKAKYTDNIYPAGRSEWGLAVVVGIITASVAHGGFHK